MRHIYIFIRSYSAFERGYASNGQSGGLDEGCDLQIVVLRVAPQLFLQGCSVGPLLCPCFLKRGQNRRTYCAGPTVALRGMRSLQHVPAPVDTCVGVSGPKTKDDRLWLPLKAVGGLGGLGEFVDRSRS